MADSSADITLILRRLKSGDSGAEAELLQKVYPELKKLAAKYMRQERSGHTLQATALVHEVYLRLTGNQQFEWHDRAHFFAIASRFMRRILVDYARERNADKRGGGIRPLTIDEGIAIAEDQIELALAVDGCLTRLAALDSRQAEIVEMRFFGGLTEEEIAEALQVSVRTVKRDWTIARAWLHAELASRGGQCN
jgi:RNA polymerase sigma-70 factor, ECF subfamily